MYGRAYLVSVAKGKIVGWNRDHAADPANRLVTGQLEAR
jgi:hypothetical protein